MNFSTALYYLKDGNKLFRKAWDKNEVYIFINKREILMKTLDNDVFHWDIKHNDVLAEDWVKV